MSYYNRMEERIDRRNRRLLSLLAWFFVARSQFQNYPLADRIKQIFAKYGVAVRAGKDFAECDNWCMGRLPLRVEVA